MAPGKPVNQVTLAHLESHTAGGGEVSLRDESIWNLVLPPGADRQYRLAQLDDYHHKPRRSFPWRPPATMSLRARLSSESLSGTWGFGFWNDPFSLSLGLGGGERRLPALPNAAWFFYASSENHLSLNDDLPANGLLAATFRSVQIPVVFLGFALPFIPLLLIPSLAQQARRFARAFVKQDALQLHLNPTRWHDYSLSWRDEKTEFFIDGSLVFSTPVTPHAPLGFVLWVDNQFASWDAKGKISFGSLPASHPAVLEIMELRIQEGSI